MARKATRKSPAKRKATAAKKKSRAQKPAKKVAKAASAKTATKKKAAKKSPIRAAKPTKAKSKSVAGKAPSKALRASGKKMQPKRTPTKRATARKTVRAAPSVSNRRAVAPLSKPIASSVVRRQQTKAAAQNKVSHPGMMGDGTEEQNLNESGAPEARITKEDLDTAFKSSDSE
jgi:hypothetical protein